MKKVLAILMVFAFCLGTFGVAGLSEAFAADYADAPLMPTVPDEDVEEDSSSLVVGGSDGEIADSFADYVVEVDPEDDAVVESFAEVLASAGGSSVSTESAKEIMEIVSTSTSSNASIIVVEEGTVLSAEAIQQTAAETGGAVAIVSTNSSSSGSNGAGDFVVLTIESDEAASLTKSVSMEIAVTTAQMSGSSSAIDIDKLSSSTAADTVVFDFSNTGNFGATLKVSAPVSMSVAKSDNSYPTLSIFSTSGDSLGAIDLAELASSADGKVIVPISITDSVVAKSTLSAFSIAGIRMAYAATQYAEVTGGVNDSGEIEITNITIVSDTIVPVIISVLSSDDLFVEASTEEPSATIAPSATAAPEATSGGVATWVWIVVALAVVALVVVVIFVVKKKQS